MPRSGAPALGADSAPVPPSGEALRLWPRSGCALAARPQAHATTSPRARAALHAARQLATKMHPNPNLTLTRTRLPGRHGVLHVGRGRDDGDHGRQGVEPPADHDGLPGARGANPSPTPNLTLALSPNPNRRRSRWTSRCPWR
eukprot:scaffold193_cov45-Phaeocystis_antarctica.AAC.5